MTSPERSRINSPENDMNPRAALILVAGIAVAAFLLRLIHAGDPVGGFHAFNEGWYALIARHYFEGGSLLFPTAAGRVDFNVPPVFSYLLFVSVKLFGYSELSMRLVPIFFGACTAFVVYALGARLFGRRAGVAAAAFHAFAPVCMVLGRNIQTDGVYVFFMLCALWLYLRAGDFEGRRRIRYMAAAGLVFGVAFMTKQFAIILLPAVFVWEMLRARGFRWVSAGHAIFGLCAALPVVPFYAFHLLRHGGAVFGAQSYIIASQTVRITGGTLWMLATEYWWGMSPWLCAVAVAGLIFAAARRGHGGLLVLCATVAFNLFFVKWHGHSYYMMFCAPFLCLAAGALVAALPRRAVAALGGAMAALTLALAMSMLCVLKYGCGEYKTLLDTARDMKVRPAVIMEHDLYGSYHPALFLYGRGLDIFDEQKLAEAHPGGYRAGRGGAFLVGAGGPEMRRYPPARIVVRRRGYELILFGFKIVPFMMNEHFFYVTKIVIARAGPGPAFDIRKTGNKDALVAGYIPPKYKMRVRDKVLVF